MKALVRMRRIAKEKELEALLAGEHDSYPCFIEVSFCPMFFCRFGNKSLSPFWMILTNYALQLWLFLDVIISAFHQISLECA